MDLGIFFWAICEINRLIGIAVTPFISNSDSV